MVEVVCGMFAETTMTGAQCLHNFLTIGALPAGQSTHILRGSPEGRYDETFAR
jgi:hypothetical protein